MRAENTRAGPGGCPLALCVEEFIYVARDLSRQPRGRFVQTEQDACQSHSVIQPLRDEVDRLQQLAQTVQGEKMRLQR